jgi:hypothetical protein
MSPALSVELMDLHSDPPLSDHLAGSNVGSNRFGTQRLLPDKVSDRGDPVDLAAASSPSRAEPLGHEGGDLIEQGSSHAQYSNTPEE